MDAIQAIDLLTNAPRDDEVSRINKNLTRKQAVEMVESPILKNNKRSFKRDGVTLTDIMEKRVHQVCENRINPRY